jgi:hypothetical protein
MTRISGALTWGIRWETADHDIGSPVVGGVLSDTYDNLRHARRVQRRLTRMYPVMANQLWGNERKPVRYFVFARREDEVHGL